MKKCAGKGILVCLADSYAVAQVDLAASKAHLSPMSKIKECWDVSLALRERDVVAKLLASASDNPLPWRFRDVNSLTMDLAEIDLVIAGHRASNCSSCSPDDRFWR